MIPRRCHEINGSRPSSLKLAGESHSIKKMTSCNIVKQSRKHGQGFVPVIIYAHSPKVIHTRAEDFMALVQRLTGHGEVIRRKPNGVSESSSSVVTEEVNIGDDDTVEPFSRVRQQHQLQNLADMPLFTPSSMTLFGFPTQLLYMSPNQNDLV